MTKRNFVIIKLFFIFSLSNVFSLGSAGSKYLYESRRIIDLPNAGLLPKEHIVVDLFFIKNGGMIFIVGYAPLDFLNINVSYGMMNFIGNSEIYTIKYPNIDIKARIINETIYLPALCFGFSTISSNFYNDEFERFQINSPGFYAAFSKSFITDLGYLASHIGINYSFDPSDKDKSVNIYFGLEKSINSNSSINLEYNFQLDDRNNQFYKDIGFCSLSYRYGVFSGVTLEIQLRDLFNNSKKINSIERIFNIEIIKRI
jgi:hypothetical protein